MERSRDPRDSGKATYRGEDTGGGAACACVGKWGCGATWGGGGAGRLVGGAAPQTGWVPEGVLGGLVGEHGSDLVSKKEKPVGHNGPSQHPPSHTYRLIPNQGAPLCLPPSSGLQVVGTGGLVACQCTSAYCW